MTPDQSTKETTCPTQKVAAFFFLTFRRYAFIDKGQYFGGMPF